MSKIPFRHPAQVPLLLDIVRHQAAYNSLIGSCVKCTSIDEGKHVTFDSPCSSTPDSAYFVHVFYRLRTTLLWSLTSVLFS